MKQSSFFIVLKQARLLKPGVVSTTPAILKITDVFKKFSVAVKQSLIPGVFLHPWFFISV
jgi:hypothetical protein